jgi:hypothetical protein
MAQNAQDALDKEVSGLFDRLDKEMQEHILYACRRRHLVVGKNMLVAFFYLTMGPPLDMPDRENILDEAAYRFLRVKLASH